MDVILTHKTSVEMKATDVSAAENGKDSCYKPRYSTCIVLFALVCCTHMYVSIKVKICAYIHVHVNVTLCKPEKFIIFFIQTKMTRNYCNL